MRHFLKRQFFKLMKMGPTLETLNFDNLALKSLPIDAETKNYVRTVNGACFSRVQPTPVEKPETVACSLPAMKLLDISEEECQRKDFAEYFSGNKLLPGAEPAAHCYCGHQFGSFAGQLGDGAAMYLGEVVNNNGDRWEIQLKGAGLTPYSRTADGRKVLRSSIREFLCSEAMHHLGIPTTRAGTCITSNSSVVRDIFYSGNPVMEKCTIVLRIAPTFIRFGSFEIFKPYDPRTGRAGPSVGRKELLEQLLNYVISTLYPEITAAHSDQLNRYKSFYKEVVCRTARMVADWQCVGFCHGVLNTDNMSIFGLTIDYGPFGFMDYFNPDHICNGSDDGGRYSYIKQPEICQWNLMKLAEAIQSVLPLPEAIKILEENYSHHYNSLYRNKMRKKLGLIQKMEEEDDQLIEEFLDTMKHTGADFTNSFRGLSLLSLPGSMNFIQKLEGLKTYLSQQCCSLQDLKILNRSSVDERSLLMLMTLIQSNHELATSLGAEGGPFKRELEKKARLTELDKMTAEEKQKQDAATWAAWLDKYVARLSKETQESHLSLEQMNDERVKIMNSNNPKFVLRNYIAQEAIEQAEKGDFTEVRRVLKRLEDPYEESSETVGVHPSEVLKPCPGPSSEHSNLDESNQSKRDYDLPPPADALCLRVTCSS